MKLKSIAIRNFRSLVDFHIEEVPNLAVIVSPNGVGKSAVVEALVFLKEYAGPYRLRPQYRRTVNGANALCVPEGVSNPVTKGKEKAVVEAVFRLTPAEIDFVPKLAELTGTALDPPDQPTIHCSVEILASGRIRLEPAGPLLHRMLSHYEADSPVGVMDYIAPHRFLQRTTLAELRPDPLGSDRDRDARVQLPAHTAGDVVTKFAATKQYLISTTFTHYARRETDPQAPDPLADLKALFGEFFSPKRLAGPRETPGEYTYVVETPYGEIDIDELSDGEKEVLMVFTNLRRIKDFPLILLYDEPELHLSAGLEPRLIPALQSMTGESQIIVTTHSYEVVGSAAPEHVFQIGHYEGHNQVRRLADEGEKVGVFRALGAHVGLQLIAEKIVFVEGMDSHSDKQILETAFADCLPRISFVACGSVLNLVALGQRVADLLTDACKYSEFYMVRDRDFLSDEQIDHMRARCEGRLFVWPRYSIENYFLDAQLLEEALPQMGIRGLDSRGAIDRALSEIAEELIPEVAAKWVHFNLQWRIGTVLGAKIGGAEAVEVLVRASREAQCAAGDLLEENNVRDAVAQKEAQIRDAWGKAIWRERFPGKDILRRFHSLHCRGVHYSGRFLPALANHWKECGPPQDLGDVIERILGGEPEAD